MIFLISENEPAFPATDQHPNASRFIVAGWYVDATSEPTEAEVLAMVAPIQDVTDLQFRLALNQIGLRASVETYVAAASQDVKDYWDRATTFRRDHPLVVGAGVALGKTDAEMDALFQLAATL
jgi:hypothetical protein